MRGSVLQEERQALFRLVLERVLVEVVDGTEQVHVMCHWHGGHRTSHRLIRPIARLDRLSTYHELITRATELRRSGQDYAAIAHSLNEEGWRPAKRSDKFSASMVQHLLRKTGNAMPTYQRPPVVIARRPDEWTIAELAQLLPVPQATLYTWVQKGRLRSRKVRAGVRQFTLVHADAAAIAMLRTVRATPAPWRRLLAPIAAVPGTLECNTRES